MYDDIYIDNTQQKFNKKWMVISPMSNIFSKTEKSDWFYAHCEQHFKCTTACANLRKCMV